LPIVPNFRLKKSNTSHPLPPTMQFRFLNETKQLGGDEYVNAEMG
jgi:hypothetical protein